ncbi:MAG: ABC-F family ATP-binding cassette domain-containing protein [Bradymonadaceae bacterium]
MHRPARRHPMIAVDSVSKSFRGRELFTDLDWQIPEDEFVGLVGPNGAGKTTLFEIVVGETEPDAGRVAVPNDVRVGYMPQELPQLARGETLIEVVLQGASDLREMEDRLRRLERRLDEADSEESVELSADYAQLEESFRNRGGYELRSEAKEILDGLGFDEGDHDRSIDEFSGGWQMRAVLARLLLRSPDVLLLDEPTNHLDLRSLEWLEAFLRDYDGTVVATSHDRYFLNSLADSIVELAKGTLRTFRGNYDEYRRKRRELRERLKQKKQEQEKERERLQEFIDKFRYNAARASQVQDRIKKLERMEEIEVPDPLTTDVGFEFPNPPRVGKRVLELDGVAKSYGENTVYTDLEFRLFRGEKVALVGPNGAGKSTLLELMAGELDPDGGEVRRGRGVDPAYFAQHSLDQLDPSDTVRQSMERVASDEAYPDIRPVLGAFGFSGDTVDKQVSVLSGGEKARLALARLLLEPSGCLLLDEPTNHLDMLSRSILEDALSDFEGAVCLISHDRYFLNEVVDKVVHVEDGEVTEYPGDYDYYRYKRSAGSEPAADGEDAGGEDDGGTSGVSRQRERRVRAELRRERRDRTRRLRERIEELESEIETLETRQSELEDELADPDVYDDGERVEDLNRELGAVEERLGEAMVEWEEQTAALEEIRDEIERRAEEILSEEGR